MKICADLVGPLVESRLPFFYPQEAARAGGVNTMYISGPMVEADERIATKLRPAVILPKHGNVARMVLYWESR